MQGVFYRASTSDVANRLGIRGWVRNEPNGDVAIHAEGTTETLNSLLEWCRKGPPAAIVTKVDHTPVKVEGFSTFEVRRF